MSCSKFIFEGLFQSKEQAKLHLDNNLAVFCDATFYVVPSISYQILITREYAKIFHRFFTTSFTIMLNKEEKTYEKIFTELKINIQNYANNILYKPKEFHSDFELGMSNAFKKVFPTSNIKFCLWHMGRALENHFHNYCKIDEIDFNINYVIKLFKFIESKNNNDNFSNFLKYFENNYLRKYNIKSWNYNDNIENTTNNCCESYNNKLKNYFYKKPTYYKFLFVLRREEDDIIKENIRLTTGIWTSKRKIIFGRSDEKDLIVRYFEDKINDLKENNSSDDTIIEEWFNCLKRLSGR